MIWKSNEGFAIAHPSLSGAKRTKFKLKKPNKQNQNKKTENNFKSLKYNYRKRRAKDATHELMLSGVVKNFVKNKNNQNQLRHLI